MMDSLRKLVRRADGSNDEETELSSTTVNLLITLLVLVLLELLWSAPSLSSARNVAPRRMPVYPCTTNIPTALDITVSSPSPRLPTAAGLSPSTSLMRREIWSTTPPSPPSSPVPEIRITFPEEEDTNGTRRPGSVVVVRIGEKGGIGLEPYTESLPPYQANSSDRFQSLDLDRMGGLKDKCDSKQYS
ncbi:hypothetical protein CIHG_08552 [Coccidioides immitis H538.4]|uniref:Uncharacterized protein n=1 Tax=Coccidioides immitis H538.4 TaxID=396776 RepID=A0A0J8S237_COCIT|nr:hypothetical protein CIHG_08552 [Coccidioides immitis H538.4]